MALVSHYPYQICLMNRLSQGETRPIVVCVWCYLSGFTFHCEFQIFKLVSKEKKTNKMNNFIISFNNFYYNNNFIIVFFLLNSKKSKTFLSFFLYRYGIFQYLIYMRKFKIVVSIVSFYIFLFITPILLSLSREKCTHLFIFILIFFDYPKFHSKLHSNIFFNIAKLPLLTFEYENIFPKTPLIIRKYTYQSYPPILFYLFFVLYILWI